jgi:hypothetical protein
MAFAYPTTGQSLHLHYDKPAAQWAEALPVGNGRLGAMVYGRTGTELLQLNEESVYNGGPQERTPKHAARHLPELRRLIRAGNHAAAEKLAREQFYCSTLNMHHYEPLGKAEIEFEHDNVAQYKRWLDLETATHSTVYTTRGVSVRRDVVASYPDKVLFLRVTASEPIEFVVRLDRTTDIEYETNQYLDSVDADIDRVVMHATPGGKGAKSLCVVLGVAGGEIREINGGLSVRSKASLIAIAGCTGTDAEDAARTDVDNALQCSWDELLERHLADYRQLFSRVSLALSPDACHFPTDHRLLHSRDPGLIALYHNYGRYLLIACSRPGPGALPANLQGIWNPSFSPAWGSKYTININLQMNYWPAAPGNLFECVAPLVDLVERMAARGATTAKAMYDCRGWCAHHNTDIWGDTDPHGKWVPATLWPLGGVWIVSDLIEMLQYHYDRALHLRLANILEGAVQFVLDFLVPSADNKHLVPSPSLSPENTYVDHDGNHGILCEGSAMDVTLIRRMLELHLWSGNLLGHLALDVQPTLNRLPPLLVSPTTGLVQEWGVHDYAEAEPGHRHISHLVGLYPGRHFNTPDLRNAARRVLDRRATHGGGHTGWSRAWLINIHAR